MLTELPFGLRGKVYRSEMPFNTWFDPDGAIYDSYMKNGVSAIVLLNDVLECKERTGRDLKAFYQSEGLHVVHLPIIDFGIPSREEMARAVEETVRLASDGENIAVHCFAGIGRTGIFMASMAKRILGMSGEDAVEWTRGYIPGACQTEEQVRFVIAY